MQHFLGTLGKMKIHGMNMMNRISFNGIIDILDGINSYDKQLIFITCNNTKSF